MSEKSIKTLDELREELVEVKEKAEEVDAAIQGADDSTSEEVLEELSAKHDELVARGAQIAAAIKRKEDMNEAIAAAPIPRGDGKTDPAGTLARVTREEMVYRKRGPNSFFRDLWNGPQQGDPGAMARLTRHNRQVEVEKPELFAEYRDISIGGAAHFIPPIYLADEWAALARAGRPLADAIGPRPMPATGDTFTVPKVSGGTTVASQATEADAPSETNATKTSVTFGVKTVAGQQDLSQQLFERSDPGFDDVIGADLAAAYATEVDRQIIDGSDAAGQVEGLILSDGINAVTYTEATPTAGMLYAKVANGVERIHSLRKLPPNLIVMAPRRWGFILSQRDSTGRPLVVEGALGPQNAMAQFGGVASEALVGTMQGLPVLVDGSIPENLGAATNEDRVFVLRTSDLLFYESPVRARALQEVLSGTLQVRLQVYGYIAFTAERFPTAVSMLSGTGLVTPTFA